MVETRSARERALSNTLIMERRILFACTLLVGFGALLWVAAVLTEFWFTVSGGQGGIYINETQRFFVHSHSGILRICRYAISRPHNSTQLYKLCKFHDMFPSDTKIRTDPSLDKTIVNYTRTEMFFSFISLCLMMMGFFFSIYTFRNPRYMFKRLAGGLHFISFSSVIVVIEVLMNSITYEKQHLPHVHPKGATYEYGFSFYLAWIVGSFNFASGVFFMLYSKKRKGDKAPNEEIAMADEPTIIGR